MTDIRAVSASTGAIGGMYGALLISNGGQSDVLFQLSAIPNVHINRGFGGATLLQAGAAFLYDEEDPITQSRPCYIATMTASGYGSSLVTIIRGGTGKVVFFEDETLSANPVQSALNPTDSVFTVTSGTPT